MDNRQQYRKLVESAKRGGLNQEEAEKRVNNVVGKMNHMLSDEKALSKPFPEWDNKRYNKFDEILTSDDDPFYAVTKTVLKIAKDLYQKAEDLEMFARIMSFTYAIELTELYDHDVSIATEEQLMDMVNTEEASYFITEMMIYMYWKIRKECAQQTEKDFSQMINKRRKKRKRR